jgi:hypothetical protein
MWSARQRVSGGHGVALERWRARAVNRAIRHVGPATAVQEVRWHCAQVAEALRSRVRQTAPGG